MDAKKRKYFQSRYPLSLRPTSDISFLVYSLKIWDALKQYIHDNHVIVDLGRGSGILIFNLLEEAKKYLNCQVFGFDFSEESILLSRQFCPGAVFKVGDVLHTGFAYKSFDIVCSTMTIEHLDDELFLREAARIIKPKGILFLSTVMRSKGAWYYLKDKNGQVVLDCTHLREYRHPQELIARLNAHGFAIRLLDTPRIKFSILDFILLRLARLTRLGCLLDMAACSLIVRLRRLMKIPIPGYFAIELIAQKQ